MFQGEIAQFAPADLLLFLCHMNKEGMLTVRRSDETVSLSIRSNLLVDAVSDPSERMILERLTHGQTLPTEQLKDLHRAHDETGLPVARILENLELPTNDDLSATVQAGLRETVFRFLLWEQGSFQFTEIPVDDNPYLTPMDGQALVMDLTREVDEYRELLRNLGSLERRAIATSKPEEASAEERYVIAYAGDATSVGALLESAPFPKLKTASAVSVGISKGWLELGTGDADDQDDTPDPDTIEVFPAYRQALRRMLQTENRQGHVRELLAFAQNHCAQSILLAVGQGQLRRATVYGRDPGGRLIARDHRDLQLELSMDPVVEQAMASSRPFIGHMFPSPILDSLEATRPAAACALLPLGNMGQFDLMLHAQVDEFGGTTGPLACLEMLSWHVRPPQVEQDEPATGEDQTDGADDSADSDTEAADKLVASIKELPPMPHVATKVLSMLADADCSMPDLTAALSQDPALVARLIKVSNSSLYGGYQETGSLDQAIVRLGTRTTRSVVVAASTRTLFPMDKTKIGLLGQELWQHAVRTGLAARRVAEFTRKADGDEAFTAGVLHDLGKVILLLNMPEEYAEVHRQLEGGDQDSVYTEREVLGFDHCLVGERLLASWGMPGNLCAVARWHHEPAGAGELAPLVQVVACGDLMSHRGGEDAAVGEWLERRLDLVCEDLGLDSGAREDLAELLALDMAQGDLLD